MAAKEKTSWLSAWLAPILLLLAALPASALTARATETRAWEKTSAPLESRPVESLQLLEGHQSKAIAAYNDALGSSLAAEGAGNTTTVIGRMQDLDQFADDPSIDTWAKSGRIPAEGEPPVTWPESKGWLDERIGRGDDFGIATDPSTLPPVKGGYIPGQPNGYFTARELEYLLQQGVDVQPMY